jgi:hypothetical protein
MNSWLISLRLSRRLVRRSFSEDGSFGKGGYFCAFLWLKKFQSNAQGGKIFLNISVWFLNVLV